MLIHSSPRPTRQLVTLTDNWQSTPAAAGTRPDSENMHLHWYGVNVLPHMDKLQIPCSGTLQQQIGL